MTQSAPTQSTPSQLAVFLHSGDYDRVHQGLSIAATAAAAGRPVKIFFSWWALERLCRDELDEPHFPGRPEVAERFEARAMPTLRALMEHARATGNTQIYACSGSLGALGLTPHDVEPKVDQLIGWSGILRLCEHIVDRFYL